MRHYNHSTALTITSSNIILGDCEATPDTRVDRRGRRQLRVDRVGHRHGRRHPVVVGVERRSDGVPR